MTRDARLMVLLQKRYGWRKRRTCARTAWRTNGATGNDESAKDFGDGDFHGTRHAATVRCGGAGRTAAVDLSGGIP
jgi:hypothetical protein